LRKRAITSGFVFGPPLSWGFSCCSPRLIL
jgi:hypothetical protein